MRQLIRESIVEKPIANSRENLPEGILCRVTYPVMRVGVKNANKRVYGKDVIEAILKDSIVAEKLKTRTLYGNQEHPVESALKLNKDETSHIVSKIYFDESKNILFQEIDVLPTEAGKFIDVLLGAGCQVGVSTRAEGELEEAIEEGTQEKYFKVLAESYVYIATDFTGDPSTPDTLPENIQKNVVDITRSKYEAKQITGKTAIALLERVNSSEAKKLCENIVKENTELNEDVTKIENDKLLDWYNEEKDKKEVNQKLLDILNLEMQARGLNSTKLEENRTINNFEVKDNNLTNIDSLKTSLEQINTLRLLEIAIVDEVYSKIKTKLSDLKTQGYSHLAWVKIPTGDKENAKIKIFGLKPPAKFKWKEATKIDLDLWIEYLTKLGDTKQVEELVNQRRHLKETKLTEAEENSIELYSDEYKNEILQRLADKFQKFTLGDATDVAKKLAAEIEEDPEEIDDKYVEQILGEFIEEEVLQGGSGDYDFPEGKKPQRKILKPATWKTNADLDKPQTIDYKGLKINVAQDATRNFRVQIGTEEEFKAGTSFPVGYAGNTVRKFDELGKQVGNVTIAEVIEKAKGYIDIFVDGSVNDLQELFNTFDTKGASTEYIKKVAKNRKINLSGTETKKKFVFLMDKDKLITKTGTEKDLPKWIEELGEDNIQHIEDADTNIIWPKDREDVTKMKDADLKAEYETYRAKKNPNKSEIMRQNALLDELDNRNIVVESISKFSSIISKEDLKKYGKDYYIKMASNLEKQKTFSAQQKAEKIWKSLELLKESKINENLEELQANAEAFYVSINKKPTRADLADFMAQALVQKKGIKYEEAFTLAEQELDKNNLKENTLGIDFGKKVDVTKPVVELIKTENEQDVKIKELNAQIDELQKKIVELTSKQNESRLEQIQKAYTSDVLRLTNIVEQKEKEIKITNKLLREAKMNVIVVKELLNETKEKLNETKKVSLFENKKSITLLENKIKEITEKNTKEISKIKEVHTFELLKKYKNALLEARGIKLPSTLQTLFEACKTEEETKQFLREAVMLLREGALTEHSISEIVVTKEVDPIKQQLKKSVSSAFKAMGR